jgi:hypothetical protein
MKALFEIQRCQRSLSQILAMGMIDKSFDDERRELEKMLNSVCKQLHAKITYANWWSDWDVAIAKQRE